MYKNDSGGNSRLESLMKMLQISPEQLHSDKALDYISIEERINKLREKSKEFLLKLK